MNMKDTAKILLRVAIKQMKRSILFGHINVFN